MKTPFKVEQFTPTQWDTAEQKAKFANHFVRFVESGFKKSLFFDWFYKRLSMTFGFIAHYNREGFYDTWFLTFNSQLEFLKHIRNTNNGLYGDVAFTYSDVERAITEWFGARLITEYEQKVAQRSEAIERKELARLKVKYETPNS